MDAGNQNPNTGGRGSSSIGQIVTRQVTVTSPDNQPVQEPNAGKPFLEGSPAGSEAQPHGSNHGWDDVRIGS